MRAALTPKNPWLVGWLSPHHLSPSSLHMQCCPPERLKFLDSQLQEQRLALRKMTAERDSLLEDILQFRASKKQSDEVRGQGAAWHAGHGFGGA